MPDTTTPETGSEATTEETSTVDLEELVSTLQELGLGASQLKTRLEHSKTWEKRAKENAAAAKELQQLRQQTMTDTEKAVEQARNEGKAEAMSLLGAAKVESAFAVAANGRLEPASLKVLIQGLNHAAFLNDDGSVDEESVATFIDGIAPKNDPNRRVDLGQGARPGGKHGPGGSQSQDPLLNALTALSKR